MWEILKSQKIENLNLRVELEMFSDGKIAYGLNILCLPV